MTMFEADLTRARILVLSLLFASLLLGKGSFSSPLLHNGLTLRLHPAL